jgi:mono/diheme cytochrome c family protein
LIQIKMHRGRHRLTYKKWEERMRKILLLVGAGMAILTAPAMAEGSGDTLRGKAYAQGMCSSCHAVAADLANSPNPTATPFSDISWEFASAGSLAAYLNTKHPPFPISLVSERQAEDILAYVTTLRKAAR